MEFNLLFVSFMLWASVGLGLILQIFNADDKERSTEYNVIKGSIFSLLGIGMFIQAGNKMQELILFIVENFIN